MKEKFFQNKLALITLLSACGIVAVSMGLRQTIGLFSDLAGVGSYFGLAPLTLSITAYLTGFLNGKYERFLPYVFHLCWLTIIGFHFFVISYVRFQTLFVTDIFDFAIKWLMSFGYTMMFFLITQYFFPVREASRA